MKFLCVPCDSPMKLQTVAPPDRGSLSIVYACPECGYEIAMLTNAYETQVVQSLGVRIGPSAELGTGPATELGTGLALTPPDGAKATATCPFAAMIPAASAPIEGAHAPGPVTWTSAAAARLANIPDFVRPMAKVGIEQFARDRGVFEVDETLLDDAREFFGM
jgi:hypothetical protein